MRRVAAHGIISTVSRYYTPPMRSASPLAPPGLHGNRLFDAPLHRFASLHGAISTSRYYTTLLCAAPRHWPRRGCVATGFLMRHCTVLLRCTAQYHRQLVDIIPPLCAAPRHWPRRGCVATGFLMRHCTVLLRCTAQYHRQLVDIIPPLCAAPRHWPRRGCVATGFLMRPCAVSLPRDGLKISFYAILKRSFSRL